MLTNLLIRAGLTRNSAVWFWGRLSSGALLVVSGLVPLENYVGPGWERIITITSAVILWLAGKYDTSPLPAERGYNYRYRDKSDQSDPG